LDTQSRSHHPNYDETTQVLIVGGGIVGLSTSLFLSWRGISSKLIERHPGTAIHPRIPALAQPTMEMFRRVGIEEAIHEVEAPLSMSGNVLLVESLVGQEFDVLQQDVDAFFKGDSSPALGSPAAQDMVEPVLRTQSEQRGGVLRFGTELVAFEQDEQGVTATIRERESGSTRTVRARYLVAADGTHSGVRQQLGIGRHGKSLWSAVSIIFEADLLELFLKRHAIMCFIANDNLAQGTLVPYPGSAARPDLYRLDVLYDPEEETLANYPEERCLSLIRAAVGIPNLAVQLKTVSTYDTAELVADRFQQGRVFLVGDAARTQPPTGGLGGATGMAEAYNLTWKLAAVLRGEAGEGLLATYDAERRPQADYTAEQVALLSQQRETEGSAGITVDTLTLVLGYRYSTGAIVREAGDEHLPLVKPLDQWKGQPGTHAPHLWLRREGKPFSTRDLFGPHFVLLVGPQGKNWKIAACSAQGALHLPLDSYQIGGEAADLADAGNAFCDAYGITATGAVLVRPDGFIGWRSRATGEQVQDAEQALTQALSTLLFR
jgi:putative polyketide hydroxylase